MSIHSFDSSRRALLQWGGAGAAGLALPVAGLAQAAPAPRHGGTLTLLLNPEPPVFTTIAHTAITSVFVSPKVTEGLLDYDFDLNPRPQLAVSWQVSPDGLFYAFKLRPNVRWHDGKPFTSADVAHSFRLLKEFHPRGRSTFASLVDIRTPDALTVQLVLDKPVPYLLTALAAPESPIVPKHLYLEGKADTIPWNNKPVGTGPFVFKEWVRGSHVVLERNPHYWDQPRPYVDRLVLRFINDPGARSAALETGEVQLAAGTAVALGDLNRLIEQGRLGHTTEGYNYLNSITRVEFNLERPHFKDVRVRQAFAHAIHRDVLVKTAQYGHAVSPPGPIAPGLKRFYEPPPAPLAHDVARAERLLDEAGYRRGADGVRLRLALDPMPQESIVRCAEVVKQALKRIGVEVTLRSQDFSAYIKRVYTDRDFDFNCGGMSNSFDPTVGIQRLYWSKSFKRGLPFSNGSGYSNPEVDALLEAAAVEIDPKKRIAQWRRIQDIVIRDVPDLTLVAPYQYTFFDKRLEGHTVGALGVAGSLAHAWFRS